MYRSGLNNRRGIVLVGKAGNGKSSLGNSILGRDAFKAGTSLTSITQLCVSGKRCRSDMGNEYCVVDTPGLFDTDKPFAERALEIQKAIKLCPNPSAFFIVLNADSRFTQEESLAIDMLRIIFGEEILKHTILVFTRGGKFETEEEFKRFLDSSEQIKQMVKQCDMRVKRVENELDYEERDHLITGLLNLVETMTESGRRHYKNVYFDAHRDVLQQYLNDNPESNNLKADVEQLIQLIKKKRPSWRPYAIGALGGAAVVTVGASAYAVGFAAKTAALAAYAGGVMRYVDTEAIISGALTILANFGKRFKPV